MPNLDEIINNLAVELSGNLEMAGVSRIEYVIDNARENGRLILLVRTRPELSARFAMMEPYQFPVQMVFNCLLLFVSGKPHINSGVLQVHCNEAMRAATILDFGEKLGVGLDEKYGVITVPKVWMPQSRVGLWIMWRTWSLWRPNPWRVILNTPSGRLADNFATLEVYHIPDVPSDQLKDEDLDRALRLSLGWNYLQIAPVDYIAHLRNYLRKHLSSPPRVLVHY